MKHTLLPTLRVCDSVGLCGGSRNGISNKFPVNAAGAVSKFWLPLLRCSASTRWITSGLGTSESHLNLPTVHHIHFPPHTISPYSSQSDCLKIWSSQYSIFERGCFSAQSSSESFFCCPDKIHLSSPSSPPTSFQGSAWSISLSGLISGLALLWPSFTEDFSPFSALIHVLNPQECSLFRSQHRSHLLRDFLWHPILWGLRAPLPGLPWTELLLRKWDFRAKTRTAPGILGRLIMLPSLQLQILLLLYSTYIIYNCIFSCVILSKCLPSLLDYSSIREHLFFNLFVSSV